MASISDRQPQAGTGAGSEKPPAIKSARLVVLAAALVIVLLGSLLGTVGLLLTALEPGGDQLTAITPVVSFMFLTVGLGSLLAWQVWRSIRGRSSRPFQPRRIWPWVLLYAVAVLLGQMALALEGISTLLFPPFHIAATVLPAIIILVAVGKALSGIASRRHVLVQFSSGAFLSTFLSLVLQVGTGLSLLAVTLVIMAQQSGGQELIESATAAFRASTISGNPVTLLPLLRSPPSILAVVVIMAGIVPLIEESVKTVGVGLLIYQRPTMARAFLWGLASGAGFAAAEALFNAGGSWEGWFSVVLMRVGITVLHCLTGGLMGIAWAYAFVKGRRAQAAGLFAGSVALHGVWNALALGQAYLSLGPVDEHMTVQQQALASLGMVSILGALGLMALGMVFGLVRVTAHVRRQSQS